MNNNKYNIIIKDKKWNMTKQSSKKSQRKGIKKVYKYKDIVTHTGVSKAMLTITFLLL